MNNKKITIIFILIAISLLLGIVGLTMAYFTSSTDFDNEFKTGLYQTQATEVFTSPSNWLPGDTTPKTLTVTNTGTVDVKARVCISEEWNSDNGDTLPNEVNVERVAILNLANTSDWTNIANCYIYNDMLGPNDTTSSFIESVTFNPNITSDISCTTTSNNSSTTKSCTSSGNGYDNAAYTLTFTVETVQANAVNELWPSPVIKYTTNIYDYLNQNHDLEIVRIGYPIPEGMPTYGTIEEAKIGMGYAINALGFGSIDYDKPLYLKHMIYNGVVVDSYLEFIITNEMVQEEPNLTAGTYALSVTNMTYNERKNVLSSALGSSNCTEYNNNGYVYYICSTNELNITLDNEIHMQSDYIYLDYFADTKTVQFNVMD